MINHLPRSCDTMMTHAKLHQGVRSRKSRRCFLLVDRVGRVDFVAGVRSPTREVLSGSLMECDIEKVVVFLARKSD
jgi:hypothetical protein